MPTHSPAPRGIGCSGRLSCIVMVKDEEEYVGYALMSVLPWVDEVIVVEGGSSDGTLAILEEIQRNHDPENKVEIVVDTRPKNRLIEVRSEMVARCTGEWILRLEGDEVYDDKTIREVSKILREPQADEVLSAGWPYWFYVDDLQTIVRIGEPHTLATIAVRNIQGLHAAHHDKGGNETFWDEGWFDGDGKEVSIHHPEDWPSIVRRDFGVHHYAAFKHSSRHGEYARTAEKVAFTGHHPEVFERYDFRPWMQHPERFTDPSEVAGTRLLRSRLPRQHKEPAKTRVLGNYLTHCRDDETWAHIKESALAFCKHTNKGIDLIVWDNDSTPRYVQMLETIFGAFDWRSLEFRHVPKTEGGPGVGSQNQRVQRAILKHAIENVETFDYTFTQEDDYWYAPTWIEKCVAIFLEHPDIDVVNPFDGPFIHANCTTAPWVAPVVNPIVDGEIRPTLYNGKPLYLRVEELRTRAATFGEESFDIAFARHIDGSNWFRNTLLERRGEALLDVIDNSYGGWAHFYDWCWPDFAMAEWLCDQGVKIACAQPSLHQHRQRGQKGDYASPSFPQEYARV